MTRTIGGIGLISIEDSKCINAKSRLKQKKKKNKQRKTNRGSLYQHSQYENQKKKNNLGNGNSKKKKNHYMNTTIKNLLRLATRITVHS